ncbi:MAG: hypothetical protein AAF696_00720, partial [Bacteroidota bacterium]
AFYSLGMYLEDEEALLIGLDFAKNAFRQIDREAGYFIEGGGWDSSYNGVALQLGFEFLALLNQEKEERLAGEYAQLLFRLASFSYSR